MTAMINSARDLLKPGESALVLFTRGRRLTINDDGSGSSGNWILDRNLRVKRVIVYHQLPEADRVDVYLADFVGAIVSDEPGRSVVRFEQANLAGFAGASWREFAETWSNPVRFISKG
jgi:hypothetical protein